MKVFFDNNVPAPLRFRLPRHEVRTAREMGWQELKNGDLLTIAERGGFQVFVTGDKNLAYQQNLKDRKISVVVLATTHWKTLRDSAAPVRAAIDRAKPGSFEAMA